MTAFEDVIDELRMQLDIQQDDLDGAYETIDELRTELEDRQDANYRFRSEIHDLVNAAGTLRDERDKLKDELSECQDNYKEMREEAKQEEVVYQERADLVRLRIELDEARKILHRASIGQVVFYDAIDFEIKYPNTK
jgi:chromosome segregation ATPase